MFAAALEKNCTPRLLRKFQQIRRQSSFHGKSPLSKRERNHLKLRLLACIQVEKVFQGGALRDRCHRRRNRPQKYD